MELLIKIAEKLKGLNKTLREKIADDTYDFDDNSAFRFEMWDTFDGQIYLTIEGSEILFDNVYEILPTIEDIEKQLINGEF